MRTRASRFNDARGGDPRPRVAVTVEVRGRPERLVKAANLALKLGLELAALAAFAYWGTTLDWTTVSVLAAVAAPAALIVLWGTFAAPRAERRLPRATRMAFELAVFALAAAALLAARAPWLACGFAALALLNAILLTRLDQWDRRRRQVRVESGWSPSATRFLLCG